MAVRKRSTRSGNDAEAVFTRIFGDTEGWDERVAAATDAAMIAEEIQALRERHGLSQAALAKRVGTSQSAIARLEDARYRGHSMPVLRRIAAAVGERVEVRFTAVHESTTMCVLETDDRPRIPEVAPTRTAVAERRATRARSSGSR